MISKSHSSQVPAVSNNVSFLQSTHTVSMNSSGGNNPNSSPKMGSRRIFTPHFKLQVLESYRKDSDCKGNQRATARKYNIHRRQIQKWLQCETNLRSSVANINQNNVKHQFHNINHHQQQPQSQHQLQLPLAVPPNNNNQFTHHHRPNHLEPQPHQHQHQHQHQLSLDAARQNVALNSITVPAIPTVTTSTNASTQGVFAAANLAAVVAAAAAAGAAGAMAIASTTSTNTTTVVSPLRPTAIAGRSGASVSLRSQQQHHHQHQPQHHHLYAIPYTHTPANMPITVPILTHHMPPQHLHHHYQYHNLSPHAHTLPHIPTSAVSALTSSACLPVKILSAANATTVAASETTNTADALPPAAIQERAEKIRTSISDEFRESATKTATTATEFTGNGYVHCDKYKRACTEHDGEKSQKDKYDELQYYKFMQDPLPNLCVTVTPMDLSLGSRRENGENINSNLRSVAITDEVAKSMNDSVVDLTFRKRKVIAENSATCEQPNKLAKSSPDSEIEVPIKLEFAAADAIKEGNDNYIDVEMEEKAEPNQNPNPPSKPIKLFKPYLLDSEDDEHKHCNNPNGIATCTDTNTNASEQREPIIWSNHPGCLSPQSYENRQDNSSSSNFQSAPLEKQIFPMGSPHYHGSKSSSPQSAFSFTSVSTLSPSSHCPEGSPVSGYESSTSTYSDSSHKSESVRVRKSRTCSLDLQIHAVYENLTYHGNCVQRWLDHERNSNPPATSASIALYA